jgi:CRP-like cAMP-binding protein
MERRSFAARQTVVRKGDPADELFLVVRGGLSVVSESPDGRQRRLATLSPGVGFGEPSIVEGAGAPARCADRGSVCWVLARDLRVLDSSSRP